MNRRQQQQFAEVIRFAKKKPLKQLSRTAERNGKIRVERERFIMENLVALRPDVVQGLLAACRSVFSSN